MHLWAYIDPGSGSMLLQVILAGILAVPFFFRRTIADVWHRVRGDEPAADEPATSPPSEERESGR
jgi:hypothetical protein